MCRFEISILSPPPPYPWISTPPSPLPLLSHLLSLSLSLLPPSLSPRSCTSISFLVDKMPLMFVLNHQLSFVMAFLYVLLDLINEVSSGTVTLAKKHLKKLLEVCNTPLKEEDKATLGPVQEKSFHLVSRHLVKEVISPNENVRMEVGVAWVKWVWFSWMGRSHLLIHGTVSTSLASITSNFSLRGVDPRIKRCDLPF